jgi:hypothetical protein
MIGLQGEAVEAPEPVDRSSIRRFVQATMDEDPMYWDAQAAQRQGYDAIVAPPLFPLHAMRRRAGTPDPLYAMIEDPDYDGAGDFAQRAGLPKLPIPLSRLLNGGNSVEVASLAQVGDVITSRSHYEDVYQKAGRQGPMVISVTSMEYAVKGTGRSLLTAKQVHIWR